MQNILKGGLEYAIWNGGGGKKDMHLICSKKMLPQC